MNAGFESQYPQCESLGGEGWDANDYDCTHAAKRAKMTVCIAGCRGGKQKVLERGLMATWSTGTKRWILSNRKS